MPNISPSTPIKVLLVFGTRPEAVKMAPLVRYLRAHSDQFECVVCVTAQHRSMLDQVLSAFEITPEYDLDIMQQGQTLTQVTTRAMEGLQPVLTEVQPHVVLAQGDTTTVLAAALAAAYQQIAFGHVEAGLRTDNKFDPFPEEINRRLTTQITDLHFTPTPQASANLLREGINSESIYLTGNTVIDALRQVHEPQEPVPGAERLLLVTTHRRENWGAPQESIAKALRTLLDTFPDTRVVLPMHKNPIVREPLERVLGDHPRADLIEDPGYLGFVRLYEKTHLVLTDSGGVQEEAPALGLPVLVLRRTTERPEGVTAGTAKLIGTDYQDIVDAASELLTNEAAYNAMSHAANPYGDGLASERIAGALLHWAGRGARPADFTP